MTEAKKPRTPPAMTLGRVIDRLERFRSERHVAADEAVRRVFERFAAREAEFLSGVTQAIKQKALATVGDENITVSATEPEDATADSDETPSRPALGEYDEVPERLRDPLPEARLAIGRKR
jgi:hypothetical protein